MQKADPLLPEDGLDLIFTCNTYHHIRDRAAYFAQAKKYLHANGRVAIIDYKRTGWFQRLFGHYTPAEVIWSEMAAAGYRLDHDFGFLPRQTCLVFTLEAR